jgi:hypothetical protein
LKVIGLLVPHQPDGVSSVATRVCGVSSDSFCKSQELADVPPEAGGYGGDITAGSLSSTAGSRDAGDYSLALILTSLDQDATWHRDWTRQLVRDCVDHEGRQALSAWIKEWRGPTEDAMAPIVSALGSESRWPAIHEAHDDYLHLCGLESR